MQVLPTATTPTPTSSSTSSTGGGGSSDDGFLSILADALTALAGELDDAAGEPDVEDISTGTPSGSDEDVVDADLAMVDRVVIATPAVPAPLIGAEVASGDQLAATVDAVDGEPPSTTTSIEGDQPQRDLAARSAVPTPAPADGHADDTAPTIATAPDPVDGDAAGDATTMQDTERAAPTAADSLRVPGWVSAEGRSARTASPGPDPASTIPIAAAAPTTGDAPIAAQTAPAAQPQPSSVAAAMAVADQASFEALEGESLWEQLATVVRPLRQLPDGSHRLSLQLRPAELGAVHLEVALEDGRLSLRAVAENAATREVLAASLAELRAELSRAGIDLGSLDVGDQTFGSDRDADQGSAPAAGSSLLGAGGADATTSTHDPAATGDQPAAGSSTRLDLTL